MRVAVLGTGSIGTRHLVNLAALGVADLVMHDPSRAALDAAALRVPDAQACATLGEVWQSAPDLVVVATPPSSHITLAGMAVQHGTHTFVEKPLSNGMEGIDGLVEAVRSAGVTATVGCNMRFHPGPATVRRLLEEGRIGKPLFARVETGSYLPRWRPARPYEESYTASVEEGGAVLDCIHELDLATWYLGPARVEQSITEPATSLGLATDGLAEALLRHDSGALSSVHLNFIERDYHRACRIVGEEGTIAWSQRAGAVQVWGEDGDPAERIDHPPSWEVNDMYLSQFRHLLTALDEGDDVMNPIEEAAATLRLAMAIRGSGA